MTNQKSLHQMQNQFLNTFEKIEILDKEGNKKEICANAIIVTINGKEICLEPFKDKALNIEDSLMLTCSLKNNEQSETFEYFTIFPGAANLIQLAVKEDNRK